MKAFTAIATTPPPQNDQNLTDEIGGWIQILGPIIVAAIAIGNFQHRIKALEEKEKKREETEKEERKTRKEDLKEEKEGFKELLEQNNTILIANLESQLNSIKQSIHTMGRLLKSQEQTVNGQRERLHSVERDIKDVLGIFNSRFNSGNPPSNPPDYSSR